MAVTNVNRDALVRAFVNDLYQIDDGLPAWARRHNPIVKRHLGLYWRIMPPQYESVIRWFLIESGVILLTVPVPFLFTVLLPLVLASLSVLPGALVYYGRILYDLAADASRQMVSEVENHTLPLLLATPIPTRRILLSKIAGALWKQSEPFGLLMAIASISQVPTLFLLYANMYPPQDYGAGAQFITVAAFAASLIRLPCEMLMTSALGVFVGAVTRGKGAAAATTLAGMGFYFLLINMVRLVHAEPIPRLLIDGLLPIAAPLALTFILLLFAERALRAE